MPDPFVALLLAAVLATIIYFLARPEKGIYAQWRQARRLTERVRREDALKYIHKCEMKGRSPTVESIAGVLSLGMNETAGLLTRIEQDGLLQIKDGEFRLTPSGRGSALHIIRAHRLLERYLADETGYNEADWHGRAEQLEHELTRAEADDLAAQLGNPTHDPHGDPIPSAMGRVVAHGGQPLTALEEDRLAHIVHLEDEPEVVYAQLVAEGLHPGMTVRVVETTPERIRFWADGDEHLLAPIVATNISVRPVPVESKLSSPSHDNLSMLEPGEQAEVISIAPTCRGAERRRLMDLGVLPGTVITSAMRSPGGDPTAYQIRGALIALRRDQARHIQVAKQGVST